MARVFIPSRARGTDTLVRREPRISAEIPSSDVQNWVRTPRADRKRHAMCPTRHELKRRLCVENRTVSGDASRPVKESVTLAHNLAKDLVKDETDADEKDKLHEQQLQRILKEGCCTFVIQALGVDAIDVRGLDHPKAVKFIFGPVNKRSSASREASVQNFVYQQFSPPLVCYNSVQQGDIYVCGDEVAVDLYLEADGYIGDTIAAAPDFWTAG
jgi:hypothetical protein